MEGFFKKPCKGPICKKSVKNLQNTLCFADFLQIWAGSLSRPVWEPRSAKNLQKNLQKVCKKSAKHTVFCRFFADLGWEASPD